MPDVVEPAPIRIVDSSTNVLSPNEFGDFIDIVCFAFVNEGPRTAAKVGFDVTLLDSSGTVLAVHMMKPAGRFVRGERSAFSHGGDPRVTPNGNCYPIYAFGRNGSTFMYRPKAGPQTVVSTILIAPRTVDYENGETWRAGAPSRMVGQHVDLPRTAPPSLEVPNGPPLVTWRNTPEAQLRIDDAFLEGGRFLYTCMSFTNLAPKTARRVRADVMMIDRAGTIVNVEHINVSDRIKPNDPLTNQRGSCLSMNGIFDGDTFLYRAPVGTVPLGRVIVSPAAIDFDDGSSWAAPATPPIGSRAPFP
ncbi:MAG TPA: hypothetical protein VGC72_18285 [Candidatus Elarobacter sp.]